MCIYIYIYREREIDVHICLKSDTRGALMKVHRSCSALRVEPLTPVTRLKALLTRSDPFNPTQPIAIICYTTV